jgi:hypothetical protein
LQITQVGAQNRNMTGRPASELRNASATLSAGASATVDGVVVVSLPQATRPPIP